MSIRRIQNERDGLCPCGLECKPYKLCEKHRSIMKINRIMNKAVKDGTFTAERRRGLPTTYGLPEWNKTTRV